jgi:hypothetical protein
MSDIDPDHIKRLVDEVQKKKFAKEWDEFEDTVAAYEKELNEPWSAVIQAQHDLLDDNYDPYKDKEQYVTGHVEPAHTLVIEDDEPELESEPRSGKDGNIFEIKYRDVLPTDVPNVDFKFDEDALCQDLLEYIHSTYTSHYSGEKYQATDLIIDAGHGIGFCIGNIIKYAKRYGKKNGYDEKDILKILHYAIILLYIHRLEGEK